jgi:hypothetical protein
MYPSDILSCSVLCRVDGREEWTFHLSSLDCRARATS